MKSFKRILLANMLPSLITTIIITLTIPVYDSVCGGFQFHGFISNATKTDRMILAVIVLNCYAVSTDLLIVILIDRYHKILKELDHSQCHVYVIYAIIILVEYVDYFLFCKTI
uniref:G_PROTEIN_RECEP_F1_2 domain-containing protein n=1 Tax=Panagrellus redivivus TaxID=6233 RepID=A0A7E4WA03_PANRE